MKAALEHRHVFAAQAAQQQPAGMALDGGKRKVRDIGVVDFVDDFHFVGQRAQSRAKDDAGFGLKTRGVHPDVVGSGLELVQHEAKNVSYGAGSGSGRSTDLYLLRGIPAAAAGAVRNG